MEPIIKTENLSFVYATNSGVATNSVGAPDASGHPAPQESAPTPVFDGFDFEIEKGKFTAIIGHNGSGKTTLAKHFNAILLPSGGRVLVDSMDTADEALLLEIRRRVGMVFQNPDNQIVATVVEEDVAFAPENLGLPSAEIRARVDEALKMVDMYAFRAHAPHLLSGGQKQRIAIAGILAMRPECIVFDEPTAMLDPRGRISVLEIMRSLPSKYGITVALITHNMDEAAAADRVVVMSGGKIVSDGAPREVFADADALRGARLDIPETLQLLQSLSDAGYKVPLDALSVDDCADAIYKAFRN